MSHFTSHPERVVTLYQVAELFKSAYVKNFTVKKAFKAFEMCGIWPLNPHIFTDEDFLSLTVTDQQTSSTINNTNHNNAPLNITEIIDQQCAQLINDVDNSHELLNIFKLPFEIDQNFPNIQFNLIDDEAVEVMTIVDETLSQPSSIHVSLSYIIPIPKISQNRNHRKQEKKSEILSGTPYKNTLVENKIEKAQKQNNFEDKRARKRLFIDDTKVLPSKRSKHLKRYLLKKCSKCISVYNSFKNFNSNFWNINKIRGVRGFSVSYM